MKTKISTKNAPAAIGPYSQAVKVGDFLFASGQIPFNPSTGTLVEGGIVEQTTRVLENIKGILDEVGLDYKDIIKTTVFIKNMSDVKIINEVYSKYFNSDITPARSLVEVARLPRDVQIEIEFIAYLG